MRILRLKLFPTNVGNDGSVETWPLGKNSLSGHDGERRNRWGAERVAVRASPYDTGQGEDRPPCSSASTTFLENVGSETISKSKGNETQAIGPAQEGVMLMWGG